MKTEDDFDFAAALTTAPAQEPPAKAAEAPTPDAPSASPATTEQPPAPKPQDDFDFAQAATGGAQASAPEPQQGELRQGPMGEINRIAGQTIKIGQGVARFRDGVIQASLDGLAKMGIIDRQTVNDWTKLKNDERMAVNEAFKKAYGDDAGFHLDEMTGEFAPAFLMPAGQAATAVARVGQAALAGGLTGATQYQDSTDSEIRGERRMTAAKTGAAAGAVIATPLELLTGLRNWLPQAIDKVKQKYAPDLAQGIDLQRRTGVTFKLSQVVRDPAVERYERLARSGDEGERLAREMEDTQPQQVLDYFENILAQPAGPRQPFGDRVSQAYNRIIGDKASGAGLLGARQRAADLNFDAARKAGGYVDMQNFLSESRQLISRFSSPGAGATERRMATELERIVSDIMDSTGGRLTPVQLQRRLEAWGDAAKGSGKILSDQVDKAAEKGPAKLLFAALNKDLDDAIAGGGQGAAALRKARDQYRMDTAKINAVRESALGKIFDVKGTPQLADIETKFLAMDAAELRTSMRILRQTDNAIADHMEHFWLSRAIERAKVPGEAGATEFLPAKLLDLRSGAKGDKVSTNREIFDAVFTEPKRRRQVEDGLAAVQTMMVNNFRTSGRTVARLKNLANTTSEAARGSQSIGQAAYKLASRWAADFLAPQHVAKYVLDPNGVKALNTLAKASNENAAAAALSTLMGIATRDADPEMDDEAQ